MSAPDVPARMTVSHALRVLRDARTRGGAPATVLLACGFTPLHLGTLLAAQLQQRLPERRVEVGTGVYGDLAGTLERLGAAPCEAVVVVFEWSDFDRRLGLRDAGGWRLGSLADVVAGAQAAAERFLDALERRAAGVPVAVALPTLPFPPLGPAPGWQASEAAAELRGLVAAFAARLARLPQVRVLDAQRLDLASPLGERLDAKALLTNGFPYRVGHAAVLAELLATLVQPPAAKKGLITDLDDTLWRGIVGEDGVEGISWDLDHKSHAHALYQQLLHALADAGVLVAVASKNDPEVVERALAAAELHVPRDVLFPVEVNWEPKSVSVGRILQAWNIGADSVVVVDDSPAELAEVQAAHPGIEGFVFPAGDDAGVVALLDRLRDLFGKARVSDEDLIRRESLRSARALAAVAAAPADRQDAFLAQAEQELTVHTAAAVGDSRTLELINKTNQFNLNGRRFTEGEWRAYLGQEGALLVLLAYRDKYGPLGKISVLAGRCGSDGLVIDAWVLSCRAFSRRIEHATLAWLFERFGVDHVQLDYRATAKNHLVADFLAAMSDDTLKPGMRVSQAAFAARRPPLFFRWAGEAG